MTNGNNTLDSLIRGMVAMEFQSLVFDYSGLYKNNLMLAYNSFGKENRYVGDLSLGYYPDIVVWKPEAEGSTKGKTVAVVLVESTLTLKKPDIGKWNFFDKLNIIFDILVPEKEQSWAIDLLRSNGNFDNTKLFTYKYDEGIKKYIFKSIKI